MRSHGAIGFYKPYFCEIFFQNYLGSISLITCYRCIGWSVPTVCAFYPDSQTAETLRSACIFMCRLVMRSLSKAFSGKQCNFWTGFNVHVQPGQCFLSSPLFCETAYIWNLHHFVSIFFSVLFKVLKLKLNLVKLTFWTAISSHQVMGMSLTKVWVMYRLFNVLCWLWNIYEGAELPSVYFITNTKHCITYLALTQLFPV